MYNPKFCYVYVGLMCVTNSCFINFMMCNILYYTGLQVEPGSCLQRLCGSVQTGLILKDISLEVRAGEVLAVLGSKGNIHTLCWSPIEHYIKWQTWKWQFRPVACEGIKWTGIKRNCMWGKGFLQEEYSMF